MPNAVTNYRALVCLFEAGGNDFANTLVPYDQATYDSYNAARPGLAIPRSNLASTLLAPITALPNSRQFALNPTMTAMKGKFDAGDIAVMMGVGPLIQPTTKEQFNSKTVPLPPNLFSHNDQQSYWQSFGADGTTIGWGGRFMDYFLGANGNQVFSCITATGNTVFLQGNSAVQYSVPPSGPITVTGLDSGVFGSSAAGPALRTLLSAQRAQLFEKAYATISKRSLDAYGIAKPAIDAVNITTSFPDNEIGAQLKGVARIIGAREAMGADRQVFFCQIGGWDDHNGMGGLDGAHAGRIGNISNCITAFINAMIELGVNEGVTLFTASDFGRTLQQNGSGVDHGWGSNHFIAGGSVRGKQFYGSAPSYTLGGSDDAGLGRMIPTTSVDQYAATLGKWFGLLPAELDAVLPNLKNFTVKDLGFMDP